MHLIRGTMSTTVILLSLLIVLTDGTIAEDDMELFGPIAHIEVQHKKIEDIRYFQLGGVNSYMHVGALVEYEWHFEMNDSTEYYSYGPFQILELSQPVVCNITLKVKSSDTREDIKRMNITIRDDGYGSTLMSMYIEQDPRLVERLEMDRTPKKEKVDLTPYYAVIGSLGFLVTLEFILIMALFLKRRNERSS
jgi:hypothetical protein